MPSMYTTHCQTLPSLVVTSPPHMPSSTSHAMTHTPYSHSNVLLQPDILLRVFAHLEPVPDLCHAIQVCRDWSIVAATPSLWQNVVAIDPFTRHQLQSRPAWYPKHITQQKSSHALQVSRKSHSNRRKRSKNNSVLQGARKALDVITKRAGTRLNILDLQYCFPGLSLPSYMLHQSDIQKIIQRCSSSITTFLPSYPNHITKTSYINFSTTCPQLKVLHMTGCRDLQTADLGLIVQNSPYLHDISVKNCPNIRGSNLVFKLKPISKVLKRIDVSMTSLTQLCFRDLALNFPSLEEFIANHCTQLNVIDSPPRREDQLSRVFLKLTTFAVNYVAYLSSEWLSAICARCSNIKMLCANDVGSGRNYAIFNTRLPSIQQLSLSNHSLTDREWQRLFEDLRTTLLDCDISRNHNVTCALQTKNDDKFSVLETLDISETGATDETVKRLINVATRIKCLKTAGCRGVKDRKFRRNPLATISVDTETELTSACDKQWYWSITGSNILPGNCKPIVGSSFQ